jgi:tellurite resistance protein TerC
MITSPDLLDALPVIASLVVIEALLSVDNALVIAAMAAHLPRRQRTLALRLGIIGAYVGRGATLAIAAWIVNNPWIKIVGAAYLVYLMCSQLTAPAAAESQSTQTNGPGLLLTIVRIEILDLSLSLDNVIAAVALSRKLWVVCTGVFIGILALRFIAGWCLRLLERLPILGQAAFVLVGYVGALLTFELATSSEVHSTAKFAGIAIIIAIAILYSRSALLRRILRPIFGLAQPPMRAFAAVIDFLASPLRKLVDWLISLVARSSGDSSSSSSS